MVNGQRPMRKEVWLEGKDPNGNVFKIRENNAVSGKIIFFRKFTYTMEKPLEVQNIIPISPKG